MISRALTFLLLACFTLASVGFTVTTVSCIGSKQRPAACQKCTSARATASKSCCLIQSSHLGLKEELAAPGYSHALTFVWAAFIAGSFDPTSQSIYSSIAYLQARPPIHPASETCILNSVFRV